MLVNSQTKSNNSSFPLASEFPAETALQGKPNAIFSSRLPELPYFKRCLLFEKVVFIHHALPYLKTKTKSFSDV